MTTLFQILEVLVLLAMLSMEHTLKHSKFKSFQDKKKPVIFHFGVHVSIATEMVRSNVYIHLHGGGDRSLICLLFWSSVYVRKLAAAVFYHL